jgi:hypothetical protein
MFQWYQASDVCYAYLSDVTDGCGFTFASELGASKWFTRGWTLQELLAPRTVVFSNRDWRRIGTNYSLEAVISTITGIKPLFHFQQACIAQKMSWASKRITLRTEDMAYCLMGLFGVNMPLLYGEGEKAFIRLQIEIMRISDDESLFAWASPGQIDKKARHGLLAQCPRAFGRSGDVELLPNTRKSPYTMTNKGLQIEVELIPSPSWIQIQISGLQPESRTMVSVLSDAVSHMRKKDKLGSTTRPAFLAALCCAKKDDIEPISIALVKLSPHAEEYSRVVCNQFLKQGNVETDHHKPTPCTIFVRQGEGSVLHRGPTTILLNLSHDSSIVKRYKIEQANFHPGLLKSDEFRPLPQTPANTVINLESFGAYDPKDFDRQGRCRERYLLTVGYGVTLLRFDERWLKSGFLVRVGISQDKPPTINVFLSNDAEQKIKLLESLYNGKDGTEASQWKLTSCLYAVVCVFIPHRPGPRNFGLLVRLHEKPLDEGAIAMLCRKYTPEEM